MEKLHIIHRLLILMFFVGYTACLPKAQELAVEPTSQKDSVNSKETNLNKTMEASKEYIGMWVTADGFIRHELLPDNRYDEARGSRKSAYQGSYVVNGNHIDYKDDTGFTADGEFIDGILYHAGMVLYKEEKP